VAFLQEIVPSADIDLLCRENETCDQTVDCFHDCMICFSLQTIAGRTLVLFLFLAVVVNFFHERSASTAVAFCRASSTEEVYTCYNSHHHHDLLYIHRYYNVSHIIITTVSPFQIVGNILICHMSLACLEVETNVP